MAASDQSDPIQGAVKKFLDEKTSLEESLEDQDKKATTLKKAEADRRASDQHVQIRRQSFRSAGTAAIDAIRATMDHLAPEQQQGGDQSQQAGG